MKQSEYVEQLATEAAAVGALLVPAVMLVSGIVELLPLPERFKPAASIFLAGAGFHLAAEASGLNDWYLYHSAAQGKAMSEWLDCCKNAPVEQKCGPSLR